ncbi:metalloenzyme domain protein [Deinococcus sp. KNUC1210]|uniref:metalloenzyme domain protein n=1 Tax=Deinococcus sp. KNUC1210 TaxID=2917691 RepID=UPI001EF057F7|nr:metalloenzyme domain protein [Deinococcus sp. KNUC1210]ULH14778.1 metalloenzyme domain protein [Deinococcus sp. KNUC1210]
MKPLIWLALDGVGHPQDAPPDSPWNAELPTLRPFVEAGLALDASLGVDGLPQSATGQTCWLTGQNGVAAMNGHYGPHPGPTLQRILNAEALPVRLAQQGARLALLNSYPPGYFEAQAQAAARGRNRSGCFPYSFVRAGLPLNPPEVPLLPATLGLNYRSPWLPQGGPEVWQRHGEALAALSDYDLLVFDAWFSDHLGHEGQDPTPPELAAAGRAYLLRLDALLNGLVQAGAAVVISSDHGNFENLSVKGHTLARVPFAATGVPLGQPSDVVEGGQSLRGWFGV